MSRSEEPDLRGIDTVLFDLDGTLYEDVRVYDRYAEEMGRFLPAEERARYLADWERAKAGESPARIGLGYDAQRDLLFRHSSGRITAYIDWEGNETPVTGPERTHDMPAEKEPIEVPIFGPGRFSIGDWWRLPDVLAAHHGVPHERRQDAFMATREYMAGDEFQVHLEPGMRDLLEALQVAGKGVVAMSNSPAPSVDDVFEELGIRPYFNLIVAGAEKPIGLERWLEGADNPERILSIGDNYVNEIEPALRAGCRALYIDRHDTGLGEEYDTCWRLPSIQAAIGWVMERLAAGASSRGR